MIGEKSGGRASGVGFSIDKERMRLFLFGAAARFGMKKAKAIVLEYAILTLATILLDVGVYVFKFPNNFTFGGVTGIALLGAKLLPLSPSQLNLVINVSLLVVGFAFVGREFGLKTVYVSLLSSLLLSAAEVIFPMSAPLTDEPVLELIYAIVLPAVSAAMMFNIGASSGGTDIIAMILKKYTSVNIGTALFMTDMVIAAASFFLFGVKTGLFSLCGLMAKSLVVDSVIENINRCKVFTIICRNPEPICRFITDVLRRSATTYGAKGAYTGEEKTVIVTIMRRSQAVQLRNFIRKTEPGAFISITNSSEIIGKGFRGFN